ncbi:E3 ubiquitin-protein ligase [Nymphaea thermarum]|nr:E3 ubiquitin-protein ligase [Nymphaea thermarum]
MEFDNIECISSSDGIDEDEPSFSKPHVPSTISPATSVHELLECPVCTNSRYPPIHQNLLIFCEVLEIGELLQSFTLNSCA